MVQLEGTLLRQRNALVVHGQVPFLLGEEFPPFPFPSSGCIRRALTLLTAGASRLGSVSQLGLVDPHIGVAPNRGGGGSERRSPRAGRGDGLGRNAGRVDEPYFDDTADHILVRPSSLEPEVGHLESATASVPGGGACSSRWVRDLVVQVHESRAARIG